MARDQSLRPLTDEELEEFGEKLRWARSEIREYLAEQGVDVSEWATDEADSDADREAADSD